MFEKGVLPPKKKMFRHYNTSTLLVVVEAALKWGLSDPGLF